MSITLYDEVIDHLMQIATREQIIVVNNIDLNDYTPDICYINDKGIVMNNNWKINVSYPFRLAHEICHILYGNSTAQQVYAFSENAKRGEELQAHKNAIRMLMAIKMPTSPLAFMNYYNVPSWLENNVMCTYNELQVE